MTGSSRKVSSPQPSPLQVGFHVDSVNFAGGVNEAGGNPPPTKEEFASQKTQTILFLYTFRKYMRWPLIALNGLFILLELLVG